jgi:hypothetical protein
VEHCPTPVPARRAWRTIALLAVLVAGITAGSATTSVVWASHQFHDVPTSSPFHADISWAADNGIANGFPGDNYHPNDAVSRQAFAAFLHRYNGTLEVVHHAGSFASMSFTTNSAACPAGKRALAGGGSITTSDMYLTDTALGLASVNVRWESENNVSATGDTDAWVLCAPA